ncbi:MAG: BREX system ATP-binding domain-containing protein [Methanoculleus sp.]|nr:DUF2791 family P-loop domain-containing protein [Methanomicrobiales archaeon]NQS73652.1 DUF2791 family P-loop domain-containing protein [Methanoculleus sp.]
MNVTDAEQDIPQLDRIHARRIVQDVGGSGQPPIYGYQFFTAGIGPYLDTIEDEYLSDFIPAGGSSFKLVIGTYGGGKTHFLYSVQGKAWDQEYITAYIELSQNSTPLHRLEEVYRAIVANLLYPQEATALLRGYDKGIEATLKAWFLSKQEEYTRYFPEDKLEPALADYANDIGPYESKSFQNAIRQAFLTQLQGDDEEFNLIVQWLKGENPPKNLLKEYHIFEKLDRSTAFKFLRDLIRWIQEIGYTGLIILMDEAEQTPSMSTRQRETLLNNLRELVDACSKGTVMSTMIFYAVPDDSFLEGRTAVYEALNQRLATVFEGPINPTGVRIDLEHLEVNPEAFLREVGEKLARIYEVAYEISFDPDILDAKLQEISEWAYRERFGEIGYKRAFVQQAIKTFHELRYEASQ